MARPRRQLAPRHRALTFQPPPNRRGFSCLPVVVPGGAIQGEGYRTSVGLRSGLTDRLEGLVKANYVDGDDFSGDFSGTVGGLVKLTDTWGVTGDVTFGDDAETYQLGVRASF